ncbi:MAG: Ig-like domain-containing protein [Luteolibacter sp.]|jgi:hypothetical protein|nr:Ig-like domain-containing protein [Luteolibacter sp.]
MKTSRLAATANSCGDTHRRAFVATSRQGNPCFLPFGPSLKHLAAALCLGAFSFQAAASSVNLAWNPNPESDVTGYRLSYGISPGFYANTVATGAVTTATVNDLEEGRTYYFSVRAVNAAGSQSEASDEISHLVPVTTPTTPPPSGTLIPSTGWTLKSVSSQETEDEDGRAVNAFDGNPNTIWHSRFFSYNALPPHDLQIDLGVSQAIQGFRYLPRQDEYNHGNIGQYEFYVSADATNWGTAVASGTFPDTKTEKEVLFASKTGRYVRLRALTDAHGGNVCSVAELRLIQGTATDVPVNHAPVASSQSASTAADKAVGIVLSASDEEGDSLTYSIVASPSKGTLGGSAPNLTYTPNADASGTDSFSFRVNDGTVNSNTATVSITLTAVANEAPVAAAQTVSTLEDKALGIVLSASDKNGDPLSYSIVANPAKGSLSGSAPNLTYTPKTDLNGSDSFTFRVNDGKANSNTATVTISITPVNDAPVALAQSISTAADKAVGIVLSASDADGNALTYSIVSSPARGTLGGSAPNLTYTPNAGASGTDSLSFRANDGTVNSNTATVSITLTSPEPTNKPPVFLSNPVSRSAGRIELAYSGQSLAESAIDPDGDAPAYTKVSGPAWLSITAAGELSGTPTAENTGLNTFKIRATDPEGAFAEASLQIDVQSEDLALPWNAGRIGAPHEQSIASGDSSALRIKSSGLLAGSADCGLLAWQTLNGNGSITTRIRTLENAVGTSRFGLTIRDSLAPNSKHAFIGMDGNGYLNWAARASTSGKTAFSVGRKKMPLNLWLRLVRSKNTILAYTSLNGSRWSQVGKTTLYAGSSCYIGLSVHGGADNLSTAVFENVKVNP